MTRHTLLWGLTGATLALLGASTGGCSDSDSGSTTTSISADGGDDGPRSGKSGGGACTVNVEIIDPACTECAQTHCCNPVVSCFSDPACMRFEMCVEDCLKNASDGGPSANTCNQACVNKASQDTIDKHNAWAPDCMAKSCSSACGGS